MDDFALDTVSVAALRADAAQAQIDRWLGHLPAGAPRAILIESAFVPAHAPSDVPLARIAAGCVCCVGQVVLRVRLTQLLRKARPRHLLLLLASAQHFDRIGAQLLDGSLGFRAARVQVEHKSSDTHE